MEVGEVNLFSYAQINMPLWLYQAVDLQLELVFITSMNFDRLFLLLNIHYSAISCAWLGDFNP